MKKLLTVFIVLILVVLMTGCGREKIKTKNPQLKFPLGI